MFSGNQVLSGNNICPRGTVTSSSELSKSMFQLEKIGHGPSPFPSQSVNLQMPCVGILGTQPNAQQDARANLRAWGGSKGGERWVRKFGKFRGWTIITSITYCPSSYFIFRRFNNPFPDHFVFQTWSSAEPPRG